MQHTCTCQDIGCQMLPNAYYSNAKYVDVRFRLFICSLIVYSTPPRSTRLGNPPSRFSTWLSPLSLRLDPIRCKNSIEGNSIPNVNTNPPELLFKPHKRGELVQQPTKLSPLLWLYIILKESLTLFFLFFFFFFLSYSFVLCIPYNFKLGSTPPCCTSRTYSRRVALSIVSIITPNRFRLLITYNSLSTPIYGPGSSTTLRHHHL
ncbi:BA75_00614T0 [Komagataella pastoris]|uniref:BA75_00614T0 n=1 Tax=Komagataella pastoris TaxID=4922 RepID=A0A1B2J9M1_PICPA|nr:BA75_00614T0 [Komagataella pastoris]